MSFKHKIPVVRWDDPIPYHLHDSFFTNGKETFVIALDPTENNQLTVIGFRFWEMHVYEIKQRPQSFYDDLISANDGAVVFLPSDISSGIWVEDQFIKHSGFDAKMNYWVKNGVFTRVDKIPGGFLVPNELCGGIGNFKLDKESDDE